MPSGPADAADLCHKHWGPESDYRPRRRGAGAPEREQAVHAGMGNALVNRRAFLALDRKHKSADVKQLGDLRNSLGNTHL